MPVLTNSQTLSIDTVSGQPAVGVVTTSASSMETSTPNGTGILAAAKTGELTTRTNGTDGTLTMDSGHGITTGQRLDIFWSGGSGYGATVGTVSGDSVPFTGLAGNVLPADESEITAQVPVSVSCVVTGSNAQFILARAALIPGDYYCNIVPALTDNSAATSFQLTGSSPAAVWQTGYGTNPISGDAVTQVFFAQGNSTKTVVASCNIGYTA